MNEIFDWNRFKKVVTMDARGIWPRFGLTILIMALIPMAVWLFMLVLGKNAPEAMAPEIRWILILGCAFVCAIMSPSRMYKNVNLNKNGIYFAMLPASHLEKFLSMLLYCFVVCPLTLVACGVAVDMVLRILPFGCYNQWLFAHGHWLGDNMEAYYNIVNDPMYTNTFLRPTGIILTLATSYMSWVATFVFTNTVFKKHKVIMTVLWSWLIGFVLELVGTPLSILFFEENGSDWFKVLVMRYANIENIGLVMGVNIMANLVWTAVFLWWTSHRIKNMKY